MSPSSSPAPSGVEAHPPWIVVEAGSLKGTEAESLRFAHAREESRLRALGLLYYGICAWFGFGAIGFWMTRYLDSRGVVSAPWASRPIHLTIFSVQTAMLVPAFATAYGLRRLRAWSPRAGVALILLVALWGCLVLGRGVRNNDRIGSNAAAALVLLLHLVILTFILRPSYAPALSPAYREAVAQTPSIRVRARLPWPAVVTIAALILIGVLNVAWSGR